MTERDEIPNTHLINFYKSWLAWAEGKEENLFGFEPKGGLCHSLSRYGKMLRLTLEERESMMLALLRDFEREGLSGACPFNEGIWDYFREADKRANSKRKAFVLARIREVEEAFHA